VSNDTQDPRIQRLFHQAADEIDVPADLGQHATPGNALGGQRPRYWAIGGAAAALVVGIVAIASFRPSNPNAPSATPLQSSPESVEALDRATPPLPSATESPTTTPTTESDSSGVDRLELADLSITAATAYSPLESAKVDTASHVLIEECMTAQGLDYSFTAAESSDAASENARRLDVMLFNNIEALTQNGYDSLLPSTTSDANDAPESVSADPDTQDALTECQRASDQQLNPSGVQAGTNQVQGALEAEQAMNISMFETLEPEGQLWSECMERGGITGASVNSIPEQVTNGEAPSIETALLDASCRTESGYTARLIEFRTTEVDEFLTTNATEISQARTARDTEIDNAERVLAERGIEVN
jgi:hypothetical protein